MGCKVLVLGEVCDGGLWNVLFEVIFVVFIVVDGGEIVVVLVGKDVKVLSEEFIVYGVNKVVVMEYEDLVVYILDGYV